MDPKVHVRQALQQPLTTLASSATNLLTLSMTLAAACRHWSADIPFAIGTALTCELCKLALGRTGIIHLRSAKSWKQRTAALAYLTLFTTFASGSVGASVLCMSQAQQTEHARKLRTSRADASAREALHSLDTQIAALQWSADSDMKAGFRTRGLATLSQLERLGTQRQGAEESVAAHEKTPAHTDAAASPLPQALATLGLTSRECVAELFIECAIALAIELAGFLFLCSPPPTSPLPCPTSQVPPRGPSPRGPGPLQKPSPSPVQEPTAAPSPQAVATKATTARAVEAQHPPIPATYAKWLRFDFGPRLESALQVLAGARCAGACRDLLHRIGEHCLRVGWTNGTIEAATIRECLSGGRDWRTVQGHLARLVDVGALIANGGQYTVAYFLEANPSVQRREQRLAENRDKNCGRQRKLRNRLQSLHNQLPQEVDLKGPNAPHNAQKPHPTPHAAVVSAAHAATHQPTSAAESHLCDSVSQPAGSTSAHRRTYGSVVASDVSDTEHEARMRRLTARGVTAQEADEAADAFETELTLESQSGRPQDTCIAVKIPDAPPINEGSVITACRTVGISDAGCRVEALFTRLSRDSVTQAELAYAAWCTKRYRDAGRIRQSVVGFMLGTIRRQRAALLKQGAHA